MCINVAETTRENGHDQARRIRRQSAPGRGQSQGEAQADALRPERNAHRLVGDNLLDDDIRNSVSFTKDQVLLPGRGVRFFANIKF
jgi:hypothetical protein